MSVYADWQKNGQLTLVVARRQGRAAGRRGKCLGDQPYIFALHSAEAVAWVDGFLEGRQERVTRDAKGL